MDYWWLSEANPERVIVAGDWHSNVRWATSVIEKAPALLENEPQKIIVQFGDFGVWWGKRATAYLNTLETACEENRVVIVFIDGNHEAFTRLYRDFRGHPKFPHLIWLERGTRWTWHERQWLALGGATSLDKNMRVPGESWFPDEEITDEQVRLAIDGGHADVMATHDCPSSVVHAFPDFGFSEVEKARAERHALRLQEVVDAVQPAHLIHGHLHIAYQRPVLMKHGDCIVTGLDMDGRIGNWAVLDVLAMKWLLDEGK